MCLAKRMAVHLQEIISHEGSRKRAGKLELMKEFIFSNQIFLINVRFTFLMLSPALDNFLIITKKFAIFVLLYC